MHCASVSPADLGAKLEVAFHDVLVSLAGVLVDGAFAVDQNALLIEKHSACYPAKI